MRELGMNHRVRELGKVDANSDTVAFYHLLEKTIVCKFNGISERYRMLFNIIVQLFYHVMAHF